MTATPPSIAEGSNSCRSRSASSGVQSPNPLQAGQHGGRLCARRGGPGHRRGAARPRVGQRGCNEDHQVARRDTSISHVSDCASEGSILFSARPDLSRIALVSIALPFAVSNLLGHGTGFGEASASASLSSGNHVPTADHLSEIRCQSGDSPRLVPLGPGSALTGNAPSSQPLVDESSARDLKWCFAPAR